MPIATSPGRRPTSPFPTGSSRCSAARGSIRSSGRRSPAAWHRCSWGRADDPRLATVGAGDVTGLATRATRLVPAFDLLAGYREGGFFLERSGLGLATSGEVDRVPAEPGPERILRLSRSILETLASIESEPGSPAPAAVASIPFDDREPAEAIVPRRAAIRSDPGETWQLQIAPKGETQRAGERERWTGRALPHDAFEEIQLRPDPEPDEYIAAVAQATQ